MLDFSIKRFYQLVNAFISSNYMFLTYRNSINYNTSDKIIILRHDVDDRKNNALTFAEIEKSMGINGTFNFRMIPKTFDREIIKKIYYLGNEIGYHYETMDTSRGNIDKAYNEFCHNLETLREIVPIETICMHGSPLSKYDNREIWTKYDYKSLGIIAEPYFDLDFNQVFYLTDTGRRWDGDKVSVRDKAMASNPVTNPDFINRKYRNTDEIIEAIKNNDFPKHVMMTFHPQRWTDNKILWLKELVSQNIKNQVKRLLVK